MKSESDKKLEAFFKKYQPLRFKKRETILRAGDMPGGVYFLQKGYVRLYSISADGKELTLIIYKPGEYFPVVWAYTETPSIYYFETYADAVLRKAPRGDFLTFIGGGSDLLFEIIYPIIFRFQAALRRMEYLTFGNAHAKVASIFRLLGQNHGRVRAGETVIQIPLTHRDIAALVGITREATSIEVEKLEKKGIIGKSDHHFVVRDMEALAKESLV